MVRSVHFDLDGTLVDSYTAITDALNLALAEMGFPARTEAEVRRMVGGGVRRVMVLAADEAHADDAVDRFRKHYRSTLFDGTSLLPGALDTLAELRSRGYRLGVATNKPSEFARTIVDHFGMGKHVEQVMGPAEVKHPKPAPDMLLALCDAFQIPAADSVYVGDMPIDAEAARNAGMPAWLLPTGSSTREEIHAARPARTLEGLSDCLDHLPPVP